MASDFRIAIDKISDGIGLILMGNFDATSAYEQRHQRGREKSPLNSAFARRL